MKFKKVVIIGMGLIGGSIGKAFLEKGLADEVIGVCRRRSSLDRAVKEKTLTKGYVNSYKEALEGADVIFIATPVHMVKEVLDGLADVLQDKKVLVMDVGSTKEEIVDHADRFKDRFFFVGAHPLAGSEKAGVEYSVPDLFQGSLCILTRSGATSEESIEKARQLWRDLGASVVVQTPGEHDEILAFTSHLPHIVAYALAGAQKEEYSRYMAAGFKDTTRIASSDPRLWIDIFMSNRDCLLGAIGRFKELLSGIEDDIRENREDALKEKLEQCKRIRDDVV